MPSTSPRLQVILPPEVMAVIARLAKLQGRSRSAVARDFLTEVAPVLGRVATTLEAAAAMDATGRAKLVRSLEAAQAALEPMAAQAHRTLERGTRAVDRAHAVSGEVRSPTRRRPRRRPSPPYQ